jgi:hypothetical protein
MYKYLKSLTDQQLVGLMAELYGKRDPQSRALYEAADRELTRRANGGPSGSIWGMRGGTCSGK